MLERYLTLLKEELLLENPFHKEREGNYRILFDPDIEVLLEEKDKSIFLKGIIGPLPVSEPDLWIVKFLEANLFGMGTRGAVIGLDSEEKNVSLAHQIPSQSTFETFKETLKDFVSTIAYWKEKIVPPSV